MDCLIWNRQSTPEYEVLEQLVLHPACSEIQRPTRTGPSVLLPVQACTYSSYYDVCQSINWNECDWEIIRRELFFSFHSYLLLGRNGV